MAKTPQWDIVRKCGKCGNDNATNRFAGQEFNFAAAAGLWKALGFETVAQAAQQSISGVSAVRGWGFPDAPERFLRDKVSQQTKRISMRLRWFTGLQGLGVISAHDD